MAVLKGRSMRPTTRVLTLCGLGVSFLAFGLAQTADDFALPPGAAVYSPASPVDATQIDPNAIISNFVLTMPTDGSDSSMIFMNPTLGRAGNSGLNSEGSWASQDDSEDGRNRSTIPGLATVATFDGAFAAQAGPSQGRLFRYSMLGNDPIAGGTTTIPTKIDEISWTLLNADGSVFKVVSFNPFESPTLGSPNFQDSTYSSSSSGTQFADAVHRAEFFRAGEEDDEWHTRLDPTVVNRVNIQVPRFVNVRLSNGSIIRARSYFTGTARDGSTFVLMLNLLFNFFFGNEVVHQIVGGNFHTSDLNVTAFPNTFLFSLNVINPNVPGGCCVLGFHTYFYQPGVVPQPRWLAIYESWISPGLFTSFSDVTALSHEISETFDDPFIDNLTPLWQFPGVPANAKICQGNLETGDPIEVLANATFPVTLSGHTYHPQNEALRQWFAMGPKSDAIHGAFSYPNESLLPHSALPCPQ